MIRSSLCKRDHGDGCGRIHWLGVWGRDFDIPSSLSSAVSDGRRLSDAVHVGITACSNLNIEKRLQDFVGKLNGPLYVRLKEKRLSKVY